MSVCPLALLENETAELHQISKHVYGRGSVYPSGIAIRYALPVLWMTSRFRLARRADSYKR